MALPKLENPKYSTELPTMGKTVYFRPFLVGEQKQLLIAQESEDQNMMLREMTRLVDTCVDDIKAETLSVSDIEWLFLQIRIKSVGETSDIILKCQKKECEADNDYTIDLESIVIEQEKEVSNIIELTSDVSVEVSQPSFKTLADVKYDKDGNISTNETFRIIAKCIEAVIEGDEIHSKDDFTQKEISDFLDSMSVVMLEDIQKYFDSAPKIKAQVEFNCSVCGENNSMSLEGTQNFFE